MHGDATKPVSQSMHSKCTMQVLHSYMSDKSYGNTEEVDALPTTLRKCCALYGSQHAGSSHSGAVTPLGRLGSLCMSAEA